MKTSHLLLALFLANALATATALAQTYVTPMMGGGQAVADMVHIDIYYDEIARQLHAQVDDSFGTPELRPLPPGSAFDPQQPYAVLDGKAYNSQYGWNVGGLFALPPGSAIWVELLDASPGLETYSGWGRLASYTPLFGTVGSSRFWKWSGVMVHNTYAVLNPPTSRLFAEYRLYLGDIDTGSRSNFMNLQDTTVRLEWAAQPVEDPMTFKFGAAGPTNGAPLSFLNAGQFTIGSESVVNFVYTNSGPCAGRYQGSIPMLVVPATDGNGGPAPDHAALGACLVAEVISLQGSAKGALGFWEAGESQPRFTLASGTTDGTNRFALSQSNGTLTADPYGFIQGRSFGLTEPGLYRLGFRLVDGSTNGAAGGPVHLPSAPYYVYLQAGLTICGLTNDAGSATALFGGSPGQTYFLERKTGIEPQAVWETVAGPLTGTNRLQKLSAPASGNSQGFFRLRSQ